MWKLSRLVAISMMASCSTPPGPGGPTSPGATVQLVGDDDCPKLGCGLNGSWLGINVAFRDLDRGPDTSSFRGQPNTQGLQIESFKLRNRANGIDVALGIDVQGDELIGIPLRGGMPSGDPPLQREALRGTRLTLLRKHGNTEDRYFLDIDRVTLTGFWTEPCSFDRHSPCAAEDLVPLYEINFTKQGSEEKGNLCSPLSDSEEALHDVVLIFRGDQYSEPRPGAFKKPVKYQGPGYGVDIDPDSTWFNIACAGTAIGKLHLLRHTAASSLTLRPSSGPVGPHQPGGASPDPAAARERAAGSRRVTTREQRQTLLKLLTADYCGIGFPFTRNGHPLSYTFNQPWTPLFPRKVGPAARFAEIPNASIDALWNENGVVCLGVPRRSDEQPLATLVDLIASTCAHRVVDRGAVPGIEHLEPGLFDGRLGGLPHCGPSVMQDPQDASVLARTGIYAISANPSR